MSDYSIFYKRAWSGMEAWPTDLQWDVFLSAFNSSDRVKTVFRNAPADCKHWLISPEYHYKDTEFPVGQCFAPRCDNEADVITSYFATSGIDPCATRLCVDITGFMRPHLLVLLKFLCLRGVQKVDVIYSEPLRYRNREKTRFSDETVTEVRQIAGYEGNHVPDTSDDWLIIGAGYDHTLIAHVAEYKESARKVQLLGLPSLRADMYQENVLRAQLASEQLGGATGEPDLTYFAPANDPFITANALSEVHELITRNGRVSNLYLCPISTKVQVLGFGLYYLYEWVNGAASMIFPFCRGYERETSQGLSRIWWYQVELPTIGRGGRP
jgi:hypothetical protein